MEGLWIMTKRANSGRFLSSKDVHAKRYPFPCAFFQNVTHIPSIQMWDLWSFPLNLDRSSRIPSSWQPVEARLLSLIAQGNNSAKYLNELFFNIYIYIYYIYYLFGCTRAFNLCCGLWDLSLWQVNTWLWLVGFGSLTESCTLAPPLGVWSLSYGPWEISQMS